MSELIKELRIGNYLEYNGINGIIYGLQSPFPRKEKRFNHKQLVTLIIGGMSTICLDECNPIPLTEEWLVKFGFFNNELKAEHNLFVWYENHIGIKGMLGIVKPCKCIYAHQLQNLYFALTGKELTPTNKQLKPTQR